MNSRKTQPAREWEVATFGHGVTARPIEWFSSDGRGDFHFAKTSGHDGPFTGPQQPAADPASRPGRVHEKGADASRVPPGIEREVGFLSRPIAAVTGPAPAPPTATHDGSRRLRHEIGSVQDELPVEAEDRPERRIHLSGGILVRLESADGKRDEGFECGPIVRS